MGEDKKTRGKNILLIVVIIIILVLIWILVPNIPKLLEPEDDENNGQEIYQQYEKIVGTNTLLYRNVELNVSITREYDNYWDYTTYEAEWTDIMGNSSSEKANTPENLLDEIIVKAEGLSTNQIKWFEYMLKNVVK